EQHIHSFLEVLPWMSTGIIASLHPDQLDELFRNSKRHAPFRLRRKERPLKVKQLFAIFGGLSLALGLPYAEELLRCYRVDRTFAPHAAQ
ncbi:MAG TPA: hypothetical protein VIG47_14300, partial [Gemmatimonadaceae bacterium]